MLLMAANCIESCGGVRAYAGSMVINVGSTFHASGGSSGSGPFDTARRIVGVLSNGDRVEFLPSGLTEIDLRRKNPKDNLDSHLTPDTGFLAIEP